MLGRLFFVLTVISCLFWFSPVDGQVDCTLVPAGRTQAICATLQKFFTDTNGNLWTAKAGWTTTPDYCTYQGITCYPGLGDIRDIILPSNNIIGPSQIDFSSLIYLQYLDLSGNLLRNAFPKLATSNINLYYINLANNQLSGLIPDLSTLTSLQTLMLNNNNFLGTYPKAISSLALLSTATCNTMGNPFLDGCTGLAQVRCTCDFPTPTSSRSPAKSLTNSKSGPLTKSQSKTDKPTKTPAKTMTGTKSVTMTGTWTPSETKTGTWTKTQTKTGSWSPSYSKSPKNTPSWSKSGKVSPVCGNGVIEKPEQCDPNAPMDRWWMYCCSADCKYIIGNTICETVLKANCRKRGRCDLNGKCVKQFWTAKNGTQCMDKNTGDMGYCNGYGKCMFPTPAKTTKSPAAKKSKSKAAKSKSPAKK